MREDHRGEVEGRAAAAAHRRAFPHDKKTATMLGKSRRTINRWANSGPPAALAFAEYAGHAPRCEQLEAFARAAVLGASVRKLNRSQLIARLREALICEARREASDRLQELEGASWLQMAEASMDDGANDTLKAALYAELEVRASIDPESYSTDVVALEVRRAH